jgi:hypothetical protein
MLVACFAPAIGLVDAFDSARCDAQAVAELPAVAPPLAPQPKPVPAAVAQPAATQPAAKPAQPSVPIMSPPFLRPFTDPKYAPPEARPTVIMAGRGGDAASRMNLEFRAAYGRARAQVLAQAKPVIWYDGEKLVLVADGKHTPGSLLPAKYDRLKALAHLPFSVYLNLRDPDGPPAEDEAAKWKWLPSLVEAVERELPTYGFTPDELPRQQTIIAASKKIITAAAAGNPPTPDELLAFTRRMGPLQEANALAAAAIELEHYRKQFDEWSKERGESFRSDVTVVISGAQMPRKRNRIVQVFAAILGVPGEGKRIIYAEGLFDEQKALNLFGTHRLDAEAAAAFFDDPARLDEDLLSRGAAKYVEENFPAAAK